MNITESEAGILREHARNMRRNIIKMLTAAGSGHTAGSLDLADIFASLYFKLMHYNFSDPHDTTRDLLVLSAGHTCPVLYAALAEGGVIKPDELMSLRKFGSRLQGHPERTALPYLETTSGPLGSGVSQAAGMAYSIKYLDQTKRRVYCVTGDGELDEGNIWEAAMFAGKSQLNNLVVFVDRNTIQLSGKTEDIMPLEPLADKWRSFGWLVKVINGNDVAEICNTVLNLPEDNSQPVAIIANTVPAKGVSFMENDYHWHGKVPNAEQAQQALEELNV